MRRDRAAGFVRLATVGVVALAIISIGLVALAVTRPARPQRESAAQRARAVQALRAAARARAASRKAKATSVDQPAMLQPLPANPTVIWIGDGWTSGAGASSTATSLPAVAAARLHWTLAGQYGASGTGFVNPGPVSSTASPSTSPSSSVSPSPPSTEGTAGTFTTRLAAMPTPSATPDLIVVQGGLADALDATPAQEKAAFKRFVSRFHKAWPSTQLLVVGPAVSNSTSDTDLTALDHTLSSEAATLQVPYIDTLIDGWLNAPKAQQLLSGTNGPDDAGYAYLAGRFAKAVKALTA